jgi:hypothetical protein
MPSLLNFLDSRVREHLHRRGLFEKVLREVAPVSRGRTAHPR